MRHLILLLFVITATITTASASAKEKSVPASRQDITMSFAPLVKQVSPAVVNIYTKRTVTRRVSPFMSDPFFEQFFGGGFGLGHGLTRQHVESALGSGVIVDPEGLVVTNAHVVAGAEEITVVLPDGREFEAEKSLVDEPSDLALLRLKQDADDKAPLPAASLKPSEQLEVGDLVLAIGNPFGVGQTVTSGIVSALARSTLDINDFNFFIQTDAAINPGNSGGPLVSMDGGVIGINTAIFSQTGGSLGIGFAIPSEMVATVIAAEKAGTTGEDGISRPWLGITAQNVTQDIARSLGLTKPGGVLIAGLHKASPARKAGLQVGDVVLAVNDRDVRDPAEMKFRMATVPLGSHAIFKVWRKGKTSTLDVMAMTAPEIPPRNETQLTGSHILSGTTVARINPAVQSELNLKEEEGVVVTDVDRRTQAASLVKPGDILARINGIEIADIPTLQKALKQAAHAQRWEIVISRQGLLRQILVR